MEELYTKIKDYYNTDNEEIRLKQKNASIEFLNTCEVLKRYITPQSTILDCAAGAGGYLDFYLQCGCNTIVASDLSEHNVDYMKQHYADHSNILFHTNNAIDLRMYSDASFDTVVCMGPLYHLRPNDGIRCLSECVRVTKPGGTIVVAYMNRYFMLWYLLNNQLYKYSIDEIDYLAENGFLENGQRFLGCAYFSFPEEIESMISKVEGCKIEEHLAIDGCLGLIYDKINDCDDGDLRKINSMFKRVNVASALGASKHNLLVLRRE